MNVLVERAPVVLLDHYKRWLLDSPLYSAQAYGCRGGVQFFPTDGLTWSLWYRYIYLHMIFKHFLTHPPFHMNNLILQLVDNVLGLQTLNRAKAPKLTRAVNLMNRYSNWITFQIDTSGRAAAA